MHVAVFYSYGFKTDHKRAQTSSWFQRDPRLFDRFARYPTTDSGVSDRLQISYVRLYLILKPSTYGPCRHDRVAYSPATLRGRLGHPAQRVHPTRRAPLDSCSNFLVEWQRAALASY